MDKVSNTFCVYPWMHQVVLPPGTIGFCCVAQDGGPLLGRRGERLKVPGTSLSEAWNSDHQKSVREKMLRGEKVEACKLCYYQESIGKDSYRQMHNREWMEKAGPEIRRRLAVSSAGGFGVEGGALYLDLRLGNLCNLKCRMCNPYNSTKIASETAQLLKTDPDFKEVYTRNFGPGVYPIAKWYDDPAFWEGVYAQLPSLRKVYLTGGEPTLIKKNYEFLRRCVESGHSKHIFLMFNINCTNLSDEFLSYLPHFEFVLINASIDGVGAVNEYIRGASDWAVVDGNLRKLLRLGGPVQIGVTPTVQAYNVLDLVELLEYVERVAETAERGLNVDFLYVTDPGFLDIRILPVSVRGEAGLRLREYISGSQLKASGLKNSLQSLLRALEAEPLPDRMDEFIRYTRSLDRARGESFADALPRLHGALERAGVAYGP